MGRSLENPELDLVKSTFEKYRDIIKNCLYVENNVGNHQNDDVKNGQILVCDVVIEVINKIKEGDSDYFLRNQKDSNFLSDVQDKCILQK